MGDTRQRYKYAIINMFKLLKETMSKELKENIKTIFHQIISIQRQKLFLKTQIKKFWC